MTHLPLTEVDMSRTRVFSDLTYSDTVPYYWIWTDTGETAYEGDKIYQKGSSYSTMTDVVIPNFRKRVSNGEVFVNPMTKFDRDISEKALTIEGEGVGGSRPATSATYLIYNEWVSSKRFPVGPETMDSWMDEVTDNNSAVAQAWANVDVSEAAALASLGELPETISWIKSLFVRAVQLFRYYRSSKRRLRRLKLSAKDLTDKLSDAWLELRYAFRPLVFEMKQAIEAAKSAIEKGSRHTARGWDHDFWSERGTFEGYQGTVNVTHSYTTTASRNYRAGVLYEIESDINGILSLWGLDQPVEAIWELTPFSFIIDWFFNIGDIISSWSVNPHLRVLGSWLTFETVDTLTVGVHSCTSTHDAFSTALRYEPGFYKETVRMTKRYANPERPILPSINLNLDWAKLTDLAAIGRSLYHGFRAA